MNNNTYLKMGTLETLLNSHTGALLQQNKVFFGDKKISAVDVQDIIIDTSAGAARVYFPIKDITYYTTKKIYCQKNS